MSEPGRAMMGTATAGGPDRATQAADSAVACPLLEGIDLGGAHGVLELIASKATFKRAESPQSQDSATNTIRRYAADDAHMNQGIADDQSLGDQLRVTVIATGLSSARKAVVQPPILVQQPMQALRTGTDKLPILNTPSVWRSARSQAAAKVDVLASNGMDDIDILAFLRKQAD